MARAARQDHDQAAGTYGRHVGTAVLAAFFAVRARDARGALAAAKKVELSGADLGALDEYVLALAYDLGGDRAQAETRSRKVRARSDSVLGLLVVRRMEADARR